MWNITEQIASLITGEFGIESKVLESGLNDPDFGVFDLWIATDKDAENLSRPAVT